MSDDPDRLIAYPPERAAALAGVSQRVLRYWELTGLLQPGIRHRFSLRNLVRLYTFREMVALLVVAELRRRKFTPQRIRKVVVHLRSRGYGEPLAELRFATSENEVYFQHDDGSWEGDARRDQLVFQLVIDLEMIRCRIRDGIARRPEQAGRIERHRGRVGNKPVFAGTRIPVATVRDWLDNGQPDDAVLRAYPDLTEADISAARKYPVGA